MLNWQWNSSTSWKCSYISTSQEYSFFVKNSCPVRQPQEMSIFLFITIRFYLHDEAMIWSLICAWNSDFQRGILAYKESSGQPCPNLLGSHLLWVLILGYENWLEPPKHTQHAGSQFKLHDSNGPFLPRWEIEFWGIPPHLNTKIWNAQTTLDLQN